MAYNGGYADRPYAGPAARAPRGGGAPRGAYPPAPQRQYDQYQDDYGNEGYDQYDDGYYDDYNAPPQDMNYGRGPPPPNQGYPQQDMYRGPPGGPPGPGRGRGPPPRGRGGPMRGGPAPRGGYPPQGGGRGYPPYGQGRPEPNGNRGPPMMNPQERDFGSPFPVFPGQSRQPEFHDQQLVDKMGGMDINGRPPPNRGPRPGPRQQASMDDYARPSMDSQRSGGRGPPPQGYGDPRRGPPAQRRSYDDYHDDGYSQGHPMSPGRNEFGPPPRSMTMPTNAGLPPRNGSLPPRTDSTPYNPPQMAPQRPSTSHGARPPPHRTYPDQGPPPPVPGNASLQPPEWEDEPSRTSVGDVYDSYYEQPLDQQQPPRQQTQNYNGGYAPRDQYDQPPGQPPQPGRPQPGPARFAELSKTKSQPNLREPQSAVFEMASDHPPMPTGGFKAYKPGLPSNPSSARQGAQGSPPAAGPGNGHPAPVRPGLMADSLVSMNDKPPPVRNYSGNSAAAGAQGRPSPASAPMPTQAPMAPEQVLVTPDELERLRAIIKVNPNDQASALDLAKKLLEAADVLVAKIPDPKGRARSRERYLTDSYKILKKLVSANNTDAMFFMADGMGRGAFGHEPDTKEAFTLYQSAAKLQHPAAAYRTAVCCEIGNDDGGGTRKDPLKAIQWYKRAAMLGDPPAMYKVGMILLKGLLGQPRNPREAVGWLKRAADVADADNPHALHELGLLYESAQPNDVIIRDEQYALQLFEKAAGLGYKFSQFRLGCAYEYGLMGCPIDPRLSILWYSRAATQQEHQSELALSGWYLTGADGILQQSDTEAYLWARKAANAGLAKAEYGMGYFTESGIGVPANMEDAKRWYWRAAAQDFPKARERLEDLKKSGRNGPPRQRERISRSKIGRQQEGECSLM
ncbi:hypothetical protein F5Y18DRAFT_440278 [Xylariaceae sp. FL1019]|nr:hypothetical protein F5Y18DRAFT_440278 [Xylariaceae sp. FL1019]